VRFLEKRDAEDALDKMNETEFQGREIRATLAGNAFCPSAYFLATLVSLL
jgi:hypothetical protein